MRSLSAVVSLCWTLELLWGGEGERARGFVSPWKLVNLLRRIPMGALELSEPWLEGDLEGVVGGLGRKSKINTKLLMFVASIDLVPCLTFILLWFFFVVFFLLFFYPLALCFFLIDGRARNSGLFKKHFQSPPGNFQPELLNATCKHNSPCHLAVFQMSVFRVFSCWAS